MGTHAAPAPPAWVYVSLYHTRRRPAFHESPDCYEVPGAARTAVGRADAERAGLEPCQKCAGQGMRRRLRTTS